MAENDTYEILKEIQKELHQFHVKITEIQGESRLNNAALVQHVAEFKEFKQEIKESYSKTENRFVAAESRLTKLENWQIKIMAISATVGAVITFLLGDIREIFK